MTKMHEDEVITDASLVRALLEDQFPEWSALPVEPVPSAGTDNAIYRVGDELVIRLPRVDWSLDQITKDHTWLPRLAPHLPLTVPKPVAIGRPALGYPWPWAVHAWIDGSPASALTDAVQAAYDLADFVSALRRIDATGGPGCTRGRPLATRDDLVRSSLAQLPLDAGDVARLTDAWEAALATPPWTGPPQWIHGDLLPGNLLTRDGRLAAVIDFGCTGVGDPAADMLPAWAVFTAESREAYRNRVDVDDHTWARGRGWALNFAIVALPYYHRTNPALADVARRTLAALLG